MFRDLIPLLSDRIHGFDAINDHFRTTRFQSYNIAFLPMCGHGTHPSSHRLPAAIIIASRFLELYAAAHPEHVEIVEINWDVPQFSGWRERGIPGDEFDLRLDVLVSGKEVERR
jgi:hypothetical protein